MSCEECSKIQDLTFNKNIDESPPIAYVRIEVANIAIVGCNKHLKILIDRLRNSGAKSNPFTKSVNGKTEEAIKHE